MFLSRGGDCVRRLVAECRAQRDAVIAYRKDEPVLPKPTSPRVFFRAYLNIDPQFDLSCAIVWSSTMTNNDPSYTSMVNFGATASHAVSRVPGGETVYMRALAVHSP